MSKAQNKVSNSSVHACKYIVYLTCWTRWTAAQ